MIGSVPPGREIRVAVVGAGAIGRGLCHQASITPGIRCVAVADADLAAARACAEVLGEDHRVVGDPRDLAQAVDAGAVAVCEDGTVPATSPGVEVVIEASESIVPAARCAVLALQHGKHLVLMNAEADLTFGPRLRALAREHGVVCTSGDGDQHGVLKRLADEIRFWGFELVLAGNIKGYLDRHATPASIVAEADKRSFGYTLTTGYTDGTKLNVEMAVLANGLGLATTRPGMVGPRARHVHEALALFDLEAIRAGGVGVVDYLLGAEPGAGVFVIAHCDDPYQRRMMEVYKMGRGPFYLFYRPHHLLHVEAMRAVVEAAVEGRVLLAPDHGFRTGVYAYAKRPLRRGERLDGLGGHTCYGLIENCRDPAGGAGLPIALADDVTVARDLGRDEKILLSDVVHDPGRLDFRLHAEAVEASAASLR